MRKGAGGPGDGAARFVRGTILRRHREHLTGIVERLQDRAAGIPPEPDVPVVEVELKGPRKLSLKHQACSCPQCVLP